MTDPSDEGEEGTHQEGTRQEGTQQAGAREIVVQAGNSAVPVQSLPDAPQQQPAGSTVDDEATRFLSGLLTRMPFHDYFCRVAMRTYADGSFEHRVQSMKKDHPRWHALCVVLDMSLRGIVALLLVVAGAAIAYKTLSPLPHFFDPGTGS